MVGAGDPVRAAMINTAYVFGNPGSVAGQPDQAARAVANYAFLTAELPYGARWRGFNPNVGTELGFGMREVQSGLRHRPERADPGGGGWSLWRIPRAARR